MNKQQKFLNVVKILAPNDKFIHQAARCVGAESLPASPDGAALEFVVAMQRLTSPAWPCKARFKFPGLRSEAPSTIPIPQSPMPLEQALKVKSAELWLKLGQPDQALVELRKLPERIQKHPAVLKAHLAVIRAARELREHFNRSEPLEI